MLRRIKKYSLLECQELAILKNGSCLSVSYVNRNTKMLWLCENNHQWEATLNVVQKHWCPICSFDRKRSGIENVISIVSTNDGVLCADAYKNAKQKFTIKCKNNHIFTIDYDHLKQGNWCNKCYRTEYNIIYCNTIANSKNGKCLSNYYTGFNNPMEWECVNGHRWIVKLAHIVNGSWCPKCKRSNHQDMLMKTLKEIFKLHIEKNYTDFEWLKDKRNMEIDMWIPELKLAIEYDGEQHFRPIRFGGISQERAEENFIEQQKRDKIKNELIKEHKNEIKYFIRFSFLEDIENKEYVKTKIIGDFDESGKTRWK